MDEALRSFLESFRLPGESPVIEHIIEFFSELFYVSRQLNVDKFVREGNQRYALSHVPMSTEQFFHCSSYPLGCSLCHIFLVRSAHV